MRATMKHRYLQYLDSGNSTNFTSPGGSSTSNSSTGGPPKSNAFSPAVVAVIGVLAGAFLIVSYYRIFLRYCNRHHISFWGSRSDNRNGGPSTIVLNMEEHTWPPDAIGLDESLISRIPTCKYKPEEGLVDGTECSVCLGEFEVGEVLRILPKCNHPFHVPCIDTWLATSSTCPLCRVNIVLATAVPYALMPPVEREGPAPARGPTMALVPAVSRDPVRTLIHHEIEVLQEPQHGQEFLEAGQLSGPSSSRVSSRASFTCAPDVDRTPDTRRSDATVTHHMRHLSLETDSDSTTTREIHVVTDTTEPPIPRPTPDTKRRLYRPRHASEGGLRFITDPRGKLPQTKRFARIMGSSSTLTSRSTASSSSLNQVVVELLAQEIFQNNVSSGSQTESTIVETRVQSSRKARQDNASFEVMWSIHEQENPLMGPSTSFHNRDSSSEMIMEEDSSVQFMSCSDSDSEDETRRRELSRSSSSKRSSANNILQPWPSKRHSLRDSVARLSKRCGSVNLRQKTEKVDTSEPVFEIFDF